MRISKLQLQMLVLFQEQSVPDSGFAHLPTSWMIKLISNILKQHKQSSLPTPVQEKQANGDSDAKQVLESKGIDGASEM